MKITVFYCNDKNSVKPRPEISDVCMVEFDLIKEQLKCLQISFVISHAAPRGKYWGLAKFFYYACDLFQ